jgi:hypothetical protein
MYEFAVVYYVRVCGCMARTNVMPVVTDLTGIGKRVKMLT